MARARWRRKQPKIRSDMTPAEVFAAFPGKIPDSLKLIVRSGASAVCRVCLEWKELEALAPMRGEARRYLCFVCWSRRRKAWRHSNPEAWKERLSKMSKAEKERRAVARLALGNRAAREGIADIFRRALCDDPPELSSEEEKLAYFRGFLAASRRQEAEAERVEGCRDLVFRIASEVSRKSGRAISYEEAVSAGYVGLLNAIRYKSPPGDFRVFAANKIRGAILDDRRENGNVAMGSLRTSSQAINGGLVLHDSSMESVDGSSVVENIASLQAAQNASGAGEMPEDLRVKLRALGLPERTMRILEAVASGHTLREAGEALGISESAAHHRVRKLRVEHGDLLAELLGACAS